MLLSECEPFKWYLVVACEQCKRLQVLFPDPSKGSAKIRDSDRCCRTESSRNPSCFHLTARQTPVESELLASFTYHSQLQGVSRAPTTISASIEYVAIDYVVFTS